MSRTRRRTRAATSAAGRREPDVERSAPGRAISAAAAPIVLPDPDAPEASIIVLAWRRHDLLAACLRSLADHATRVAFETIVVLNGATAEVRDLVQSQVRGARVVDSDTNLGFGGGNNRAARLARGDLLVFLNDDAEVLPAWLDRLVAAAQSEPTAGAVGSCVLFPDGTVQDAGGIVWGDGTTAVLDRGRAATTAAIRARRPVDYVSACAVLVRRSTFEAVGGFDEAYYPAYYEDADLSLAIDARGEQVLVEPTAMVVHHESASSTGTMKELYFRRNRRTFRHKWRVELANRPAPDNVTSATIVTHSRPRHDGPQVLVIDDRAPTPSSGSGYPRALDGIRTILARPRVRVTFAPGTTRAPDAEVGLAALGVPVVDEAPARHLADPGVRYDVVVISRPNNFEAFAPIVRLRQPDARVVYDAEALYHRRLELQAALTPDPAERADILALAAHYEAVERRIATEADHVVTLSVDEAAWLREVGHAPVTLVPPELSGIRRGPAAWRRRTGGLLVAGWMAGPVSPNADGLRWYHDEVQPRLRACLPWFALSVTGADPPPGIRALRSPGLAFVGSVADLAGAYAGARVALAPVRYGAGVKIKVVEALQHGVPVVTTTVGAEGFAPEWRDVLLVADDPAAFADHAARLASSRPAWTEQRLRIEAVLTRAAANPAPTLGDVVGELLETSR